VARAITIGREYFLPHAQLAFGEMARSDVARLAGKVWKSIGKKVSEGTVCVADGLVTVSRRELFNWNQRAFREVTRLDPVLEFLCRCYYLRPTGKPGERTGRGGAPSPSYHVNPKALD
jgi:hypothetical protein